MEQDVSSVRGAHGLYILGNIKPPVNQLLASVVARLSGFSVIACKLLASAKRNDPFTNKHTSGYVVFPVSVKLILEKQPLIC